MTDFITNGSAVVPDVKADLRPSTGAITEWAASDANMVREALLDLRTAALGVTSGFVDPNVAMVTALGTSSARALAGALSDWIVPEGFGAVGNGITDDTTAFSAALATGKNVRGHPGSTYLINGGLATAAIGQVVDMTGCTVKLKTGATSKAMLALTYQGASVRGGTWDLNVAGNPSDTDAGYATYAVGLAADYTRAEGMIVKDSYGLGIKAYGGRSYTRISGNLITNCGRMGVYCDGSDSADQVGNVVTDNVIDVSANSVAQGIYLASFSPYTYRQRRFMVSRNVLVGYASTAGSQEGVYVDGTDGVVDGNVVQGFGIGISMASQILSRNIVANNVVKDVAGPSAMGVEVTGGQTVINGNRIEGGKTGISCSCQAGGSNNLSQLTVVGNQLYNQSGNSIQIQPAAGVQGRRLNITGNTVVRTSAGQCINLANDCTFTLISGNQLVGPGSGVGNTRGVFSDSVNGDLTVTGNRFSGFERAMSLYNAGAVAQNRVFFTANDLSDDVPNSASVAVVLEGSATWGDGVKIINNSRGYSNVVVDDILDRKNNIIRQMSDTFADPNGSLTAGIGSEFVSLIGGSGTTLWVKQSGSGNTGWGGK